MKKEKNFCPIRNILDRFGDKWSIIVLMELESHNSLRYNDLWRMIPDISERMLAITLRKLEADNLIHRKEYLQVPPRVEYSLTPIGLSLIPHIKNLVKWALDNGVIIMESRENYIKDNKNKHLK
ncbi:MAG: helix-turn-helix transcriptional regulator [Bacteroidales bacterium]|jgi:DNA-binding HxlR family transcriptional regulator|nr:helix-turn-helix transcriptional regulator [Bacteroidales bacterium]